MPFTTLENRFADLEVSTRALSAEIHDLSLALVAVHDLQVRHHELDRRASRTRRALWATVAAFCIVLPLACLILYATVVEHVDGLFDALKAQRYQSCVDRNKSTDENIRRELALSKADSEPAVRAIHIDSAARLRTAVIDCEKFRRVPPTHDEP